MHTTLQLLFAFKIASRPLIAPSLKKKKADLTYQPHYFVPISVCANVRVSGGITQQAEQSGGDFSSSFSLLLSPIFGILVHV